MLSSHFLDELQLFHKTRKCGFLVLIDPDNWTESSMVALCSSKANGFLVGGSLLTGGSILKVVTEIKKNTGKPVFLFPGYAIQICAEADGILLPSLISGRNPEYLIGQHVHASFAIEQSKMEVISTGYLLIGDGTLSTTQYITQTFPVPASKPEVVLATALAGIQLGMRTIYLEAGSGAGKTLPPSLVKYISDNIHVPLLVGGGIATLLDARALKESGANMIIVGNALEKNINFIEELNQLFQ